VAKKSALTITLHATGVRETLSAFRALPKDASAELRKSSLKLAESLAVAARAAGKAEGGQAAAVARTVKARKDRVPSVQAGGSTRVGRKRAPAFALLFGSEFGMDRRSGWYARSRYRRSKGSQYEHPHRGREGAWFFPTIEARQAQIMREWQAAADRIIRSFGGTT